MNLTRELLFSNLETASEDVMATLGSEKSMENRHFENYEFFVNNAQAISDIVNLGRLTSRIYVRSHQQLTDMLPVCLFSSDTVILQFANDYVDADGKHPPFFSYRLWRQYREIDDGISDPDIGDVSLRFAPAQIFRDVMTIGKNLVKSGCLYVLPTMQVNAWSGFQNEKTGGRVYNVFKVFDISHRLNSIMVDKSRDLSLGIGNILVPILRGIDFNNLLMLVNNEWDAFCSCRERLLEAQSEILGAYNEKDAENRLKRTKREIIDDGLEIINKRYKTIRRKCLNDAISSGLVYATLTISSIKSTSLLEQIAYILGIAGWSLATLYNALEFKTERDEIQSSPFFFLNKLLPKT